MSTRYPTHVDGDVHIASDGGEVQITTVGGDLKIYATGDVQVNVTSVGGDVVVEGRRATVRATTIHGQVKR